jgi:aerobic C4-dicarboxylate transport protein
MAPPPSLTRPRFYRTLYFRVAVGIVAGILLGSFFPQIGEQMKPFSDGFIKLTRMMIAPIIFFTVVTGIANIGDMRKLGRVGVKALVYFEAVTTLALIIGLVVVNVVKPGAGINADAATLDPSAVAQYASQGQQLHAVDFVLNVIPDTVVNAFAKGEILQVLLVAILTGLALASFPERKSLLDACDKITHVLFRVIALIMETAPLGAFGAMAFTISRFGLNSLLPLATLMACFYATSIIFVFVVLGGIMRACGFSIWRFLKYIREELLIVLSTSSSEPALPRMIAKMEQLGCAKPVVGLVIPSGYSFNLDGTSIYLTIAAIFVAQATNTHLSLAQEIGLLVVLLLSSKGAATVSGGGFVTLAATLSAVGTIPVTGLALIIGVDRFMSEMRALTNLVGNGVATIVVAKWEGELDQARAERVLGGESPELADFEVAAANER